MGKLKIITGENNPILRAVSEPVKKFDGGLRGFVKNLKDIMVAANGLGIAAPQVGKNIRVFIVTLGFGKEDRMSLVMINPQILWVSDEMELGEEGCLSLPGIYGKVERHKRVKVEFFDVRGSRQELDLTGLDARVVQHENDHINGVLFIDKMGKGEEKEDLLL